MAVYVGRRNFDVEKFRDRASVVEIYAKPAKNKSITVKYSCTAGATQNAGCFKVDYSIFFLLIIRTYSNVFYFRVRI